MTDQQAGERNEIAALAGPFWTPPRTFSALGLSPDELNGLAADRGVLRLVTSDGGAVYPVWQFQRRDSVVEVKPGLVGLFRATASLDGWTVAVLLHTPAAELDDTTPLDWLRSGGSAEILTWLAGLWVHELSAGST